MRTSLFLGVLLSLFLVYQTSANAIEVKYDIFNLDNQGDLKSSTYTGPGYVGMYSYGFAGIFGIEKTGESRTALNVDVAGLLPGTRSKARC